MYRKNDPAQVYCGDTHLHTSLSFDASAFGNRIGPEDAYRFARGATLTASNGMQVRLRRPLDFLVIADHAETIGVMDACERMDPALLQTKTGKQMLRRFQVTAGYPPMNQKRIENLWLMVVDVLTPSKLSAVNKEEDFTRSAFTLGLANGERCGGSSQ